MSKATRAFYLISVNLLVLAALVAAVEYACSFFVDRPAGNIVDDFRLNHTWRPDSTMVHDEWAASNPDFPEPYVHTYNGQGWVMPYDIDRTKPAGTYRIFYVGDSFTEGTAPMELSVPALVGSRLNEAEGGRGMKFEVINTGTSSYSPTIFYVLVRYVLMEYSPDLIVLNVDMTDNYDDWKYSHTLITDGDGNPWAVPPRDIYAGFLDTRSGARGITLMDKLNLFLFRRSNCYNLALKLRGGRTDGKGPATGRPDGDGGDGFYGRWAWCQDEWPGPVQTSVGRTLDMLRRIARFCELNGARLMITSVPHYYQYAGFPDASGKPYFSSRPHYAIASVAREAGVPYLNSYEELAPYIAGTPQGFYYYEGDMHFNPRGYEIWAKAHLEFLLDDRNGLLPEDAYD